MVCANRLILLFLWSGEINLAAKFTPRCFINNGMKVIYKINPCCYTRTQPNTHNKNLNPRLSQGTTRSTSERNFSELWCAENDLTAFTIWQMPSTTMEQERSG